jgi:hypothetical protein
VVRQRRAHEVGHVALVRGEAADEPLERAEGGGRRKVGREEAAEAGDRGVEARVDLRGLLVAVERERRGREKRLAEGAEARVEARELLEACARRGRAGGRAGGGGSQRRRGRRRRR